jgi:CBS domain-containing protein
MQARDLMTTVVVTVTADTPVSEVARVLLDHCVSAVPVVDTDGAPIGMVSEGDLATRSELERTGRRDWWLKLLADASPSDSGFLEQARAPDRTAGTVMTTPVVTVGETTDVAEVAQVLAMHRIKRVPVLKDGRVVGIVSRADLLRVIAAGASGGTLKPSEPAPGGFLSGMFGTRHLPTLESAPVHGATEAAATATAAAAAGFRALEARFHSGETQKHVDERLAADKLRHETVGVLLDAHVSDEAWRQILQHAREAAEHGATECLILRFPSQLCLDGGRLVNIADAGWPATLRGEAAELFLRWEQELKPAGFRLSARVLDFPGGKPGDIGIFVVWGE